MRIRAQLDSRRQSGHEPSATQEHAAKSQICIAPWAGLLVKPDGTLMPCCAWQVRFGNLFQEGITASWHSANFERFRADMHHTYLGKGYGPFGRRARPLPGACLRDCPVRASMFRHPSF
jgi:MoaA/NifB/PqqE/SkfB family radical SAM enzyme